jgi:hypothetical protein
LLHSRTKLRYRSRQQLVLRMTHQANEGTGMPVPSFGAAIVRE